MPCDFYVSDTTDTIMTFKIDNCDEEPDPGDSFEVHLYDQDDNLIEEKVTDNKTLTFTSLEPDTTYTGYGAVKFYDDWHSVGTATDTTDKEDDESELDYIEITPSSLTLYEDESYQLTCTAYYDDGSSEDITDNTDWETWPEDTDVANVSSTGYVTAESEGSCYIDAYYEDKFDYCSLTVETDRPDNFEWDIEKVSDEEVEVTANEWTRLQDRINEFREYEGLSTVSFTSVSKGDYIEASHWNEVRNAINDMNPPTSPPSTVTGGSDGDYHVADDYNLIRDSLNSIE